MITRYTRPEMGRIWSEENKYKQWLEVELAASEALAELGDVPNEAAQGLRRHARTDAGRIAEIERETRHDVIAFTTCVAESMASAGVAEYSRWLHYGLTSNDVVDTAQALQIKESSALLLAGMRELLGFLKQKAFEHKSTVMIGRTHGIHAEPYTFGLKFALWYDELRRDIDRFERAADDIRAGKISGAVGTFAHIGPEAEERICATLGLRPAPIASQVISRDLHAAYMQCAGLGAVLCARRSPSKSGTCNAPRYARPRSHSGQGKRAHRRCRTSAIPSPANRSAVWREWCGPMCRQRTKTSRFGMSATSRTRPSSV